MAVVPSARRTPSGTDAWSFTCTALATERPSADSRPIHTEWKYGPSACCFSRCGSAPPGVLVVHSPAVGFVPGVASPKAAPSALDAGAEAGGVVVSVDDARVPAQPLNATNSTTPITTW